MPYGYIAYSALAYEMCNGNAAKRFFKRLLKGLQYVPRVIIADKLRSYGVAQ
jgi:transposase-like protein